MFGVNKVLFNLVKYRYLYNKVNKSCVVCTKCYTSAQSNRMSGAKQRGFSTTSIQNESIKDGDLLKMIYDLVLEQNLAYGDNSKGKVVEFKHPEELKSILNLSINEAGVKNLQEIKDTLASVSEYSVKTRHPHFYNQLYGGIDEVSLSAAWMVEALNTNQHTYEVAPVFILAEHQVIQELIKLFGWEDGDGIFNPGGSMSNIYGMTLARHHRFPELKTTGLFNSKPLVALTSDQCHYSVTKSASLLGHGLDQVEVVPTDTYGRMTGENLRQSVKKVREAGKEPYFVNATSGTTVFGAFDPLEEISQVCQEEGLWLHVDACWGGSAILSKDHKHLMDGVNKADSIAWNPHKMIGAPLQCSPFIVRHKGLLSSTNCAGASYLFQQDKFYDVSYDTGDKSIQCGRKPDAFKLWFLLKLHGYQEMERRVNQAFNAARYLESEIRKRPHFRLVLDKHECTNICFWYIPPCLRGLEENADWWTRLSKVAPKIKSGLVQDGTLLVGYQPVPSKDLVNFIRMITTAVPAPTHQDMDYVINEIERIGRDVIV